MKSSIFVAMLAVLLLAVPAAIADNYGYYDYPYDGSRSYESYQRTYNTDKSDISSRTVTNYPYYPVPMPYDGNWYNPGSWRTGCYTVSCIPAYPSSWSDNYNRQYHENTNEMIKVDKYIRYDDFGAVRVVSGDPYYGSSRPYFYQLSSPDAYTYRYPYAGEGSGDRGYFAQPYYIVTQPANTAVRLPDYSSQNAVAVRPLTRYPTQNIYTMTSTVKSGDGPSQTYLNQITDRGPLYAPIQSVIGRSAESGGALRNPTDKSSYTSGSERDTAYVQVYISTK